MNKSEGINELATALAKAQAEMKNPHFDSNNPHFRSRYASLASVIDAITPALTAHGLSITQLVCYQDGMAGCETILMHSSGQYVSNTIMIPVEKNTAHGVMSAISYTRRYSALGIVNKTGDEDDDGNAAVGKVASTSPAILKGPITPTTDAWEGIAPERRELLHRIADAVREGFASGDGEGAYEYLEQKQLEAEEKIAVWSLLDSKIRSSVKKMHKEKTTLVEQA